MSNESKLKSLNRQRGSMKAKLTSFRLFLETLNDDHNTIEELEIINLEQRFEKIKELIANYDACQTEIEQLTEDDGIDECYTQREEFETKYYEVISKAQKLIYDLKPKVEIVDQDLRAQFDHASRDSFQNVKLPQLKLPQFDGSYDKWPKFRDMFCSMIHSDGRIDPIAKFQYLQGLLSGEAAKVLDGLEVSNVNYEAAWELLSKRYQNKNLMIHKHIGEIIEYPRLTKESHEFLRRLVDAIRSHMRALTALEQPVDKWDSLLIYLISDKLDTSSKKEWERERIEHENLPNMEGFLEFLKKRCQLLEKENAENVENHTTPYYTYKERDPSVPLRF
nr:PREDICTED: uncharacterized protein LOC105668048 [Linepithema humile]